MGKKNLSTIESLENYFNSIELSTDSIELNNHTKITNIKEFVKSHLSTIKANFKNPLFLPYLDRLVKLKDIISNDKNDK